MDPFRVGSVPRPPRDMQTYGPIYVYTLETEVYDDMNRGLREARAAHSAAEPYKVVEVRPPPARV